MEQKDLYIPLFAWLLGGARIGGTYNDYCGSVTQHPQEPMWGQKIFNYRVFIEKIDDTEYLRAAWYPGMLSYQNTPEDEITSVTFDCDDRNLPELKAWLEEQKTAFFATE